MCQRVCNAVFPVANRRPRSAFDSLKMDHILACVKAGLTQESLDSLLRGIDVHNLQISRDLVQISRGALGQQGLTSALGLLCKHHPKSKYSDYFAMIAHANTKLINWNGFCSWVKIVSHFSEQSIQHLIHQIDLLCKHSDTDGHAANQGLLQEIVSKTRPFIGGEFSPFHVNSSCERHLLNRIFACHRIIWLPPPKFSRRRRWFQRS